MAGKPRMPPHLHPFGLPPEQRERVRPTVLAIGLLATAVLVTATPMNDFLLMGTYIAGNHFPIGAFAVLLVLTLVVNVVLRKLSPRLALSPAQLIAVWALVAVPSGIPSSGLMRLFVPGMVTYRYFASPENKWDELLGDEFDPSLAVQDERAVKYYYEGLPPGASIPWQAWFKPAALWGTYTFALYAMMIGLSVMLRRRWVEQERFTFPMVQVPLEVASGPEPGRALNSFMRNRQVWLAVIIVVTIHSLRGLRKFYPSIPDIPLTQPIRSSREEPLSFIGSYFTNIYPLMVGFAYLLSSEVCFSFWFFFVFVKLRSLVIGLLGLPAGSTGVWGWWGWASLEEAGGTIALALWFIWMAKGHFYNIFHKAFTGDPSVQDADEPLSYRATVSLFLIGSAVMIIWLVHFGGSVLMALANVAIGIAVFVTLAWTVAQGGLIFVQPTFTTTGVIACLTGSRPWSVRGLLVNVWNEQVFRMDLREYLLPSLMNVNKIADPADLHRGSLLKSCLVSIGLAFCVALAASIWLPYAHGGALSLPAQWHINSGRAPFEWTAGLSVAPMTFNLRWVGHFAGGFLFILAIMWLRANISWFALHPIGFVIASGYPPMIMWLSIFIGWLIKSAIMRWGGYKVYQNLRPFFFGLIVGDCLVRAAWIIVGFITQTGYMLLTG